MRRRAKACSLQRRMDEGRHHIAGPWTIRPILARDHESCLNPGLEQRVCASTQCEQRGKVVGIGDVLKHLDRWKDGCYELD